MSKGNGNGKGNSVEISVPTMPGANGGTLLAGGMPGNKGGGRPPSAIRERCRGSFAERIPILEEIADDVDLRPQDRVKAIDVLAKYGGVDKLALTPDEQPEQGMTPERVTGMWEALQRIKTVEAFEKLLISATQKQIAGGE